MISLKKITASIFKKNINTVSIFPKYFCEEVQPPKFKTNLVNDYETAKKQVFWRMRNIGQKELEYIVMKWYAEQSFKTLEELRKFSEEVLEMENPEMNKYFVKMDPAAENLVYTRKIQQFILDQ